VETRAETGEFRTVDCVGRGRNHLLIPLTLRPGPRAHPAQATDDILGDFAVVGKLLAQLLHHAIDVVELGLVTGGRRARHAAAGHVGPIDAVHGRRGRQKLILRLLLLLLQYLLLLLPLKLALLALLLGDVLLLLLLLVLLLELLVMVLVEEMLRRELCSGGRDDDRLG
jgi:hypothetical protein